jgi:hypothetical protein
MLVLMPKSESATARPAGTTPRAHNILRDRGRDPPGLSKVWDTFLTKSL